MSTANHSLESSISAFISSINERIDEWSACSCASHAMKIPSALDDPAIVNRLAHHYGNLGYVVYVSKKENGWWMDISWKSPE